MTFYRAATRQHLLSLRSVILLSFCLALLIALAHPRTIFAQDVETSSDVIRINTDLVTVPVVVINERGRRVPGLAQSDFTVRDEGSPVEVSYFAAGAERVAIAFLLDASGSTRHIISQQRDAALALLSRYGPTSRTAVFHFREQLELVAPFSTDLSKAQAAFDFPALPNRRTAIFDAAFASVRAFNSVDNERAERRIIILISDGLDTVSRTPWPVVVNEAKAQGVSFYVIHFPLYTPRDGRLVARPTAKGFRELARQTGGSFFTAGDAKSSLDPHATYNLESVFKAIAEDIQGQYMIGYYLNSSERGQRDRRIEVRLASSQHTRKLRVRTLRGSYTLRAVGEAHSKR